MPKRPAKTRASRSWIRNSWFLEAEAILLVGVAQELLQRQIKGMGWPKWGQTLWIMGCVLGILGGLVVLMRGFTKHAVTQTHKAAQSVPLVPPILFHLLAFVGLFFLYAWIWDLWPPF